MMLNILAILLQVSPSGASQPMNVDNAPILSHMSEALHQSVNRVLSLLIAVLPGILAIFAALAIFSVIGIAISALLRRILTIFKFDERMASNRGNVEWTPSSSPTGLVARISFWACVLLGLVIGVAAFDTSYATGTPLPISLLPYFTHAVGAILLLIAGNLIARFLARSVLIGAVNAQLQYARLLSLGVKWLVLVLTAAMVLDHLRIGGNVVELAFGILFGGIVLTLALAIGLGSRDLVSRSLESHVERNPVAHSTPASNQAETIRHF
ncbi:MAG TPA: hypothetical protein V6C72_00545 [Chroococcales cyanobacterium]|nr:hypothetical protein [Terracidiphilus sp.]